MTVEPIDQTAIQTASRLTIAPSYKDPVTGALYIHEALRLEQPPYAEEAHIPPMRVTEQFGDVESFVAYVERYGGLGTLLTWNAQGLRAVLDYAEANDKPGRRAWVAFHPFEPSCQWRAWLALASGKAFGQRQAVESLEDLAEDIVEPAPADLMSLLRSLRASVNSKAETELRPDGTTFVNFSKDTTVKSTNNIQSVDLPSSFAIAIPVLKGHLNAEGRPVLYRLQVRVRVSADENAHLMLRFSIPNAERVLEDVYADRVKLAAELLGDTWTLLRAADRT